MRLVRCENGHIYDQDLYASCPDCEKEKKLEDFEIPTGTESPVPWQDFQYDPPNMPIEMPDELGETVVIEKLGQGSTGQVYRVQQTKEYAVKVIRWEKSSCREKAYREFEIASQLRECPFIVPYFGYYEKRNASYLVQELSTPWFKWYRHRSCTVEEVLCGILNVLKAVRAIRQAGLAHFDIKPGNLFVSDYGVRLGDFSHAFPVRIAEKYPGPRGTLPYMAPEIRKQAPYNGTEDLYSLGITMYSLLTGGSLPYGLTAENAERKEDDRIQTLFMHADLVRIIEKATAFAPEKRYQSPEEFENAIHDFISVNFLLMTQEIPAYSRKDNNFNVWRESTEPTMGTVSPDGDFRTLGSPDCSSIALPPEPATKNPPVPVLTDKLDSQNSAPLGTTCCEMEKKASPAMDEIRFTAAADCAVNRGDLRILEIAMFTDVWEKKVLEEMHREIGEDLLSYTSGKLQVGEKTEVTVKLFASGIDLEEAEDTQVWNGEYLKFVFDYEIPSDYEKNQVLFRAKIFFNGIQATTLRLSVPIRSGKVLAETIRQDIRSAFISYARKDMDIVTYIIQAIRAARPDMDLFFDLEKLHAGEFWKTRLKEELMRRDMLYLCWSKNAAASEWVAYEWQAMLEQKGLDAIAPIPLDGPDICPVPEKLTDMHFDGLEILIRNASRFAGKGRIISHPHESAEGD